MAKDPSCAEALRKAYSRAALTGSVNAGHPLLSELRIESLEHMLRLSEQRARAWWICAAVEGALFLLALAYLLLTW